MGYHGPRKGDEDGEGVDGWSMIVVSASQRRFCSAHLLDMPELPGR